MTVDEWGETVHLRSLLQVPPLKRLEIERDRLVTIIATQREHIKNGTRSADPDSPEEIVDWAVARLDVIQGRIDALGQRG